jgi:putative Flp pilus-assembly TadE/G-like protein
VPGLGLSMKLRLRRLRDERGSVLIVVAVFMTSAIALITFVVDVGHWFEHKRHLQAQVDAGALAGATAFDGCASASATDRSNSASAANGAIETQIRKYAGDTKNNAAALNAQVNNKPNVTVVINASKYPGDGGANYDDPAGPPCASGYVDVKSTDANLPLLFASSVVPKINAHARVSIEQVTTLSGSLPLAVEDVNPLATGALVVNEDNKAILARQTLAAGTPTTLNGQSLTPWTGGPASFSVTSPNKNMGVVFALCSNPKICGPTKGDAWLTDPTKTLSQVCGQLFVTCVNGDQTGLEFIQGYSTSGTGSSTVPLLRSVTLRKDAGSGACTDDSAPYFMLNGGCKIGVDAVLNFGMTGDPSKNENLGGINATVSVGGCDLNYASSSGTNSNWSATNCRTIASGAGKVPLALSWATQTGSGKSKVNSSGTFPQVARPFANDGPTDTQSYPIAYARLSGSSASAPCADPTMPTNSFAFGSTATICIGIGVFGNLKIAADASDPTKLLKFGNASSHTGAVDCASGNLRQQIAGGCTVPVQVNTGEACPNATNPVDCLPIITGVKRGQEDKGMDDRWVVNGVCTPNNWPAPGQPINILAGDTRAVPLIVTLYGAFAGSGSGYVPVTGFAAFYVTGWDGASNKCNGINESPPTGATNGTIWGHFIKYVGDLGSSTGTVGCDFSALAPCIPVMTQ